jgi:hypothetical protein
VAAAVMSGGVRGSRGPAVGYEPGRVRTAEGVIELAVPQVRGVGEPFRVVADELSGWQQRGA